MLLTVPGKVLNRIMLERLKNEVDSVLRDHLAGLRQDRGCIDSSNYSRTVHGVPLIVIHEFCRL